MILLKGGEADVPLFKTIKTNAGTQPKNELQQLALVWQLLNEELQRNGGETTATANYCRMFWLSSCVSFNGFKK